MLYPGSELLRYKQRWSTAKLEVISSLEYVFIPYTVHCNEARVLVVIHFHSYRSSICSSPHAIFKSEKCCLPFDFRTMAEGSEALIETDIYSCGIIDFTSCNNSINLNARIIYAYKRKFYINECLQFKHCPQYLLMVCLHQHVFFVI